MSTILIIAIILYTLGKIYPMDIDKTVWSIFSLILALIPPALALIIFKHDFIKSNDVFVGIKEWAYPVICVMYSACFLFLYLIEMPLVHPYLVKKFGLEYLNNSAELYKAACWQVLLYSSIAILITYVRHGEFIHFIGNSFIVVVLAYMAIGLTYLVIEINVRNGHLK